MIKLTLGVLAPSVSFVGVNSSPARGWDVFVVQVAHWWSLKQTVQHFRSRTPEVCAFVMIYMFYDA